MPVVPLRLYWQTTDKETVKLYLGNVADVLARLPEKSVHCVVTSPPYWGLRDYGTGTWSGGDPACDHVERKATGAHKSSMLGPKRHMGISLPETNAAFKATERQFAALCAKCGAVREDKQLGSEPSPDCGTQGQAQCGRCFVCSMVGVFREVRRVLWDDGTLWLNLGDTYSGGSGGYTTTSVKQKSNNGTMMEPRPAYKGLVSGNLVGIPWRVALALQADGWVLRQDLIWAKKSPMPESVQNRCTKAHEYVFLLTKKGSGYYYDQEAVREQQLSTYSSKDFLPDSTKDLQDGTKRTAATGASRANGSPDLIYDAGRNKRSVWTIDDHRSFLDWLAANDPDALDRYLVEVGNKADVWRLSSAGYPGAHFATFPEALIKPMILAGTSERGCCADCGAPWRRVVEEKRLTRERPNKYTKRVPGGESGSAPMPNTCAGVEFRTVGWEPTCECHGTFEKRKVTVPKSTNRYTGGDRNDEGDAEVSPRLEGEKEETVAVYVPDIPLDDHPVIPCTVLDPFIGSGTTAAVCVKLGRHSWGIDLSEQYLRENAVPRVIAALLSRPITSDLVPHKETAPIDLGQPSRKRTL